MRAPRFLRGFASLASVDLVRSIGAASVVGLALLGCDPPRTRSDAGPSESDAPVAIDAAAELDAAVVTTLAPGATITALALFQGVRVPLAVDGVPTSSAIPIVAGRDAVVRAYVASDTYPRTIEGVLEVRVGTTLVATHHASAVLTEASREDTPSSVLAFDVPASELTPSASIAARLVEAGGDTPSGSHPARLPRDGSAIALRAQDDADGLRVVLVPLRWQSDGSGRLPDTSEAWLEQVRTLLTSVYPLVDVRLEVHAPIDWSGGLTVWGSVDFGAINAMLFDLRSSEAPGSDAYYYGLVAPAEDLATYCTGTCVTGQSYVVDSAADEDYRVGSGADFGTENSAWTLVHEVGHEHGRYHAPCGTSGADSVYPYGDGTTGTWGYDARSGTFLAPDETYDFMGYCEPTWVSDYTWSAIFERTLAVSALASRRGEALVVRSHAPGGAVLVGRRTLALPSTAGRAPYAFVDARGRVLAEGSAPAFDQSHTDERLVVVPVPPLGAVSLVVDGERVMLVE